MTLAPTSLAGWGEYVRTTAAQYQRPTFGMITRVYLYAHPKHGKEAIGFEVKLENEEMMHKLILLGLIAYFLLTALPFVPGAEIRLTATMPRSSSRRRFSSAFSSFRESTFCSRRTVLTPALARGAARAPGLRCANAPGSP